MKYGNNADEFMLDAEIDTVFSENFDSGLANGPADRLETFGILQNALNCSVNLGFKPVSQSRLLFVVPGDCIFKFEPCLLIKNYLARDERPLMRSFSSARTWSQGIPLCGLRASSSPRRSNSAICSGVNSSSTSPNSSQTFSATSYCSSTGNRRICSKISDALMAIIYPVMLPAQTTFSVCVTAAANPNPPAHSVRSLARRELRVPGTSSIRSFQPGTQRMGIPARVVNSQHRDFVRTDLSTGEPRLMQYGYSCHCCVLLPFKKDGGTRILNLGLFKACPRHFEPIISRTSKVTYGSRRQASPVSRCAFWISPSVARIPSDCQSGGILVFREWGFYVFMMTHPSAERCVEPRGWCCATAAVAAPPRLQQSVDGFPSVDCSAGSVPRR